MDFLWDFHHGNLRTFNIFFFLQYVMLKCNFQFFLILVQDCGLATKTNLHTRYIQRNLLYKNSMAFGYFRYYKYQLIYHFLKQDFKQAICRFPIPFKYYVHNVLDLEIGKKAQHYIIQYDVMWSLGLFVCHIFYRVITRLKQCKFSDSPRYYLCQISLFF